MRFIDPNLYVDPNERRIPGLGKLVNVSHKLLFEVFMEELMKLKVDKTYEEYSQDLEEIN